MGRIELIYGDNTLVRHATIINNNQNKEWNFCIWTNREITAHVDDPFTVTHIRNSYFYFFNNALTFDAVMRYLDFQYSHGVTCVDGVFIRRQDVVKPFFDVLPNTSKYHAVFNCNA